MDWNIGSLVPVTQYLPEEPFYIKTFLLTKKWSGNTTKLGIIMNGNLCNEILPIKRQCCVTLQRGCPWCPVLMKSSKSPDIEHSPAVEWLPTNNRCCHLKYAQKRPHNYRVWSGQGWHALPVMGCKPLWMNRQRARENVCLHFYVTHVPMAIYCTLSLECRFIGRVS